MQRSFRRQIKERDNLSFFAVWGTSHLIQNDQGLSFAYGPSDLKYTCNGEAFVLQ